MNKKIILLFFIGFSFLSQAQTESTQDLKGSFSAIIVSDINTSIDWYSSVLGLKMLHKTESKERGFKQSNLKKGAISIELIELNKAINLKKEFPNFNNKMRFNGLFKIGFLVSNFDKWMLDLKKKKVSIYGNVVTDNVSKKRMVIILDPDGNRIQLFEN
jgi:catechol 2,3-dioxygenase-like lactoylglutathione lyase family enzyme